MNKLLEKQIEQSLKTIEQSKDWISTYEEKAKILTDNKELLNKFHKDTKEFETIQFYLVEVCPTPPAIFKIQAKYQGQPIAAINITKENTIISTEEYNDTNKKIYNCEFKLDNMNLNTKEAMQFLTYFNKDMKPKGKIDEQAHAQAMLLSQFAKTSSYDKLLIGIRPITYSNLYFPFPIILNPKEEAGYIDMLTRTKVRKLSIMETLTEASTPETVLANATSKAVFLSTLLHSEQGQQWYKIMGFSRSCNFTSNLTCMYSST